MKTKFMTIMLVAAAMLTACTGKKTAAEVEETACDDACKQEIALANKWQLVDFETADSIAEAKAEYVLTINEDGTFGMSTDCNSIGGEYTVNGDSIKFDNIAQTLMACPDEYVERAMAAIFPVVDTYAINGNTLVLRTDMRIKAQFKLICPEACKADCEEASDDSAE